MILKLRFQCDEHLSRWSHASGTVNERHSKEPDGHRCVASSYCGKVKKCSDQLGTPRTEAQDLHKIIGLLISYETSILASVVRLEELEIDTRDGLISSGRTQQIAVARQVCPRSGEQPLKARKERGCSESQVAKCAIQSLEKMSDRTQREEPEPRTTAIHIENKPKIISS